MTPFNFSGELMASVQFLLFYCYSCYFISNENLVPLPRHGVTPMQKLCNKGKKDTNIH